MASTPPAAPATGSADTAGLITGADVATLWDLLARRAALTPDAPMLIDEATTARPGDLRRVRAWAERVAAGLLRPGRHRRHAGGAGSCRPASRSIVLSFALARLGTTQVPIIPIYREREVGSVLRRRGVRFFAVPGTWRNFDYEAMAKAAAGRRPAAVRDARGRPTRCPRATPPLLPAPPTDGDAVRWLYSTSGTTAAPKCVMHSDRALIAGGMGLALAHGRSPTTWARSRSRARTSAVPTTSS